MWDPVFLESDNSIALLARLVANARMPDGLLEKAAITAAYVDFCLGFASASEADERASVEAQPLLWRTFCAHQNLPEKYITTNFEACLHCGASMISAITQGRLRQAWLYTVSMGSQRCALYFQSCSECHMLHTPCFRYLPGGDGTYSYFAVQGLVFMASEDTIFETALLQDLDADLLHQHGSFNGFSNAYNDKHNIGGPSVHQSPLDRRRLADAYFRYVMCHHLDRLNMLHTFPQGGLQTLDDDLDRISVILKDSHRTWYTNHSCGMPGCTDTLIADGNQKWRRPVCGNIRKAVWRDCPGVKNGKLRRGCTNTPVQGCNGLCSACYMEKEAEVHVDCSSDGLGAGSFDRLVDCHQVNEVTHYRVKFKGVGTPDRIVSFKDIPVELLDKYHSSKAKKPPPDVAKCISPSLGEGSLGLDHSEHLSQAGLLCQTSKDRTAGGSERTAGILAVCSPCGIIVSVDELFGSESISQVYAHLCELFETTQRLPSFFGYDDGCHLARYVYNQKRFSCTAVSWIQRAFSRACFFVDRLHFKNHVDSWCKQHMDVNLLPNLSGLNTQVCEQTFSFLSQYAYVARHLGKARYNVLLLHMCHRRNSFQEKRLAQKGLLKTAPPNKSVPSGRDNKLFSLAKEKEAAIYGYGQAWLHEDDDVCYELANL